MSDRDHQRIEAEISRVGRSTDPFAAAVRTTRMPMAITDPHQDDNPIVFVNDAFCRLTGYSREEIIGRNCRFLQGAETDQEQVLRIRTAIAQRIPVEATLLNYKKSGETFWNRLLVSPVFDDANELIYFFASQYDDNAGFSTHGELVETRQVLDALLRTSSDVRYSINADWTRLHRLAGGGFIPDTLVDNPNWIDEYIPAEDRDALRAEIERATTTKTDYAIEHRVNQADGSVGWAFSRAVPMFDAHRNVTGWMGAASDITERKRAQEDLEQLAATLEQEVRRRTAEVDRAWRISRDLLVVARPDGVLERINQRWTELLGWHEHEIVGHSFLDFTHPEDAERTLAAFQSIFDEPLTEPYEYRLRHRDGSYRWIAWTGALEDERIYAAGRVQTLERSQAEALRQSQKMEAVGQLTGGLAHDFNNLLTGMMGNLELLQTKVARGRLDDLDRFINAAQGAGRRAASLTQRLLAFSRRQTLDPRPTDINKLIAGLEEMLFRTVGPVTDIEVVGAAGLWAAEIDAGQLENAILNLCINGRDSMPTGGKLTIETANKWIDDRTGRERDMPPGQYIAICVTDTGTGMSPETLRRAFEPFYTTKPIGQGTGLGLSMIYGFAQQSGGQVRIYSEVGLGTTVCIYLPRHHGDVDDDIEREVVANAITADGQTILVVDDEATIRHLIDEVLDEQGYTVIGAADGAAGLKVLQSGARIELLITDVGLPGGINGRQVADAARALRPGLKVLFITGFADNAAVGNGHLEPGMELLTKPFTLDALTSRVADMFKEA